MIYDDDTAAFIRKITRQRDHLLEVLRQVRPLICFDYPNTTQAIDKIIAEIEGAK